MSVCAPGNVGGVCISDYVTTKGCTAAGGYQPLWEQQMEFVIMRKGHQPRLLDRLWLEGCGIESRCRNKLERSVINYLYVRPLNETCTLFQRHQGSSPRVLNSSLWEGCIPWRIVVAKECWERIKQKCEEPML